jgi:hypothetical protein
MVVRMRTTPASNRSGSIATMPDAARQLAPSAPLPPALLAEIQQDWRLQEYDRALARMEAHWRADPQDPVRSLHYATILGHCSRFSLARALLDELVRAAAPSRRLWALGSAGVACCDFQRFDWASGYMQQAAMEPSPPPAVFHRWAEALERLNRLPEARAALAEGQSRFPAHPGLKLMAARIARRDGDVESAERQARDVVAMLEASSETRCQAGYELGHALDSQDRCDEAYAAFLAAKEIQQPQAMMFEAMWRSRVAHMRSGDNLPTAAEFRQWAQIRPRTPRRHAFLVGCPRSGTTLLERMLGSHPGLASSSESAVWHSAVWMPLLRECGDASSMRAVLAAMRPRQVDAGRDRYWQGIAQTVDGDIGDRLLLDKNPSILSMLAGAVRLFPEASVLVALRDPRDIVWSCFTQALPINAGTAAFTRLESTAEQVSAELEGWLQLRPRLATPWLEVRNLESGMRRALSVLGVPWSESVLAFHQRSDMVRSPTYAAASQPVHQRSIGRWRRYPALFEPLKRQLGKAIRELE